MLRIGLIFFSLCHICILFWTLMGVLMVCFQNFHPGICFGVGLVIDMTQMVHVWILQRDFVSCFSTISSFWKYICRCIPAYDSAKSIGRFYNLFYWGEPWQWILRIFAEFPRQIVNGSFYLTIDVACSETSWYFFRYVVVDNFLNSNLAYFKHIL